MQYAIIDVEVPETHVAVFHTGAEAGKEATALNAAMIRDGLANRFRVIPIKREDAADDWKARERQRIVDGTYRLVPWASEAWCKVNHFAHISTEDAGKLAFTPNAEYGAADRQLRMRPGRYLTAHYADVLSAEQIKEWCAKLAAENNALKFASTPDAIQWVYEHGPNSCMSHEADDYEGECHPVRVYGAGDLAIAYILNDDKRVSARAICRPARKCYGRMYGDYNLLLELLVDAGYRGSDSSADWRGARLLRIEHGDGFIAPYLDSPMRAVDDDGEFLVISDGGEIECRETNGTCDSGWRYRCARCEERCDETYAVDGDEWCSDCYGNHAWRCNDCDRAFGGDVCLHDDRGNDICERCAQDYTTCISCDEYHHSDDVTYSEVTHEYYCEGCAGRMERTPCGEIAENEDDCDCDTCERQRADDEAANFELSADDDSETTEQPERFTPVHLKPTSPRIYDPRQAALELWAA